VLAGRREQAPAPKRHTKARSLRLVSYRRSASVETRKFDRVICKFHRRDEEPVADAVRFASFQRSYWLCKCAQPILEPEKSFTAIVRTLKRLELSSNCISTHPATCQHHCRPVSTGCSLAAVSCQPASQRLRDSDSISIGRRDKLSGYHITKAREKHVSESVASLDDPNRCDARHRPYGYP